MVSLARAPRGKFLLRADQEVIAVKLVAWPSNRGERIFLTFDPISIGFSERVRAAMWQLTTLAETETRSYLKRPATGPPTHPTGGPSDGETEVTDSTLESRIPADSEPEESGGASHSHRALIQFFDSPAGPASE